MGASIFGQVSGTANNGGKFYTAAAIASMEAEMPGGVVGENETIIAARDATITAKNVTIASLNAALTASNTAVTASNATIASLNVALTSSNTHASDADALILSASVDPAYSGLAGELTGSMNSYILTYNLGPQ